ncbi:MAG: MBL fold metallo-hydrolase [Odoribacter splanchnicus]
MESLIVTRIENNVFNSNTFILTIENCKNAWLVDCGDFVKVRDWLLKNDKELSGIFVTHSHFDHIYGINEVISVFPMLQLYACKEAFHGMRDCKLNGSLYTENSFVIGKANDVVIANNDCIGVEHFELKTFSTPGHSLDSYCYQIGNYLFTGDALIPNVKVVTKIKGGDKKLAQESVDFICHNFTEETIIAPGHNKEMALLEIKKSNFIYV